MTDLYTFVVDKVNTYVPGQKVRRGRSLNFRCPVCGDSKVNLSKKRGWITINKRNQMPSYHCWNCDVRMGAYQFAAFLSGCDVASVKKEYWSKNKGNTAELLKSFTEPISGPMPISVEGIEDLPDEEIPSEIDFGDNWVDYTENEITKRVVESRKVLEAPFAPPNWKLYYDTKLHRLVIPWIRDGAMVYYQNRAIIKCPVKYTFPKNIQKDVFGLDTLDESIPYVFFTEGVFDAIFVRNCLAIGGLSLSEHQAEVCHSKTAFIENHVFFPDNQWLDKSAMDITLKNIKAGKKVFIWPKEFKQKDVNDYVLKNKNNPFLDIDFMSKHVYEGIGALTRLKFMR